MEAGKWMVVTSFSGRSSRIKDCLGYWVLILGK
jgi:hypothetical protein